MSIARPALVPALVYQDPRSMLGWLERAFDFKTHLAITAPDGHLTHAEMTFGTSRLVVTGEWTLEHASPKSIAGKNTQTIYIRIDTDVDEHCSRARAAGAQILMEPQTMFYGDRVYRCRDPEGGMWTIARTVEVVSREEAEKRSGLTMEGWGS